MQSASWETPPVRSGPAYYIDELVKRLSKYVDVVLVVPAHGSIEESEKLVVKKVGSIDVPIVRVCMFAARASLMVNKLDVDLIHDNGVLGFSNFSPFIETWHHSDADSRKYASALLYFLSYYREQLTLKGIRRADSIIAISSVAKEELIEKFSVESSRINVVPHGVDTDVFKPHPVSQVGQFCKKKGKIYLLFVGSLTKRKNLESLLKAIAIILRKRPDIHLLMVGDGEEKTYLKNLVELLHLSDNVTFFGSVSRETLIELYNLSDYLVLPSYKEGFGMIMLEALACEKPVVTTPVGISSIIEANKLGVVAGGFTPFHIASALDSAINEPSFNNLRNFVLKNFTWSKTVDETIRVYKQTLDNH